MAVKLALVSFEFENIHETRYDPAQDHDFAASIPETNEGVQPVVREAYLAIKRCIAQSISSEFNFGIDRVHNINNYLHIASTAISLLHQPGSSLTTYSSIVYTAKFYQLLPKAYKYKVSIDIEELPASEVLLVDGNNSAFQGGRVSKKRFAKFVQLLDRVFALNRQIEYVPILRRGRLSLPLYLISSDERVLEYDFDKTLFHKQSEFQNIKIVSSPSLGNTLLLDDLQNLSEEDTSYTYALMDRGNISYSGKEILILGGGDGALLWELLKEVPEFVTLAEIDPLVIEACRLHMRPFGKVLEKPEGENYKIIVYDCMKFLRESAKSGKKYDVIFNDLTDIPVTKRGESLTAFDTSIKQKDNPWHFIEAIFNLSLDCLAEGGLYINHATGKGNLSSIEAYEKFLASALVEVEFSSRTAFVPSFAEFWMFYTVSKKKKMDEAT